MFCLTQVADVLDYSYPPCPAGTVMILFDTPGGRDIAYGDLGLFLFMVTPGTQDIFILLTT
jgi:hypothetical protein